MCTCGGFVDSRMQLPEELGVEGLKMKSALALALEARDVDLGLMKWQSGRGQWDSVIITVLFK